VHQLAKAIAGLPQHVIIRHEDVVEKEL